MKKFNLSPTMLDKIKGDTILVKYSALQEFANYCKENIKEKEKLEKENCDLKQGIEELNRKLNQKILDEEVGKDSKLVKLEKENEQLKKELEELKNKYQTMEKMYLDKIKELSGGDYNKSIEKTIKETIKKEFEKLQQIPDGNFEITI